MNEKKLNQVIASNKSTEVLSDPTVADKLLQQKKELNLSLQKERWKEKEEFLNQYFERVEAFDFYRTIFPVGSFERKGCYDDRKPNGLGLELKGKKRSRFTVTDDLDGFLECKGKDLVITAPVSYVGVRRTAKNARWIYGLTVDLDYVDSIKELQTLCHQVDIEYLPKPTYIVNSGTGMHLYFIFEEPVPAYPSNQRWLRALKYSLIALIWNNYTSTSQEVQYQGIVQGYRVVGSLSKLGPGYPVTAYAFGNKVSIDYLLTFIEKEREPEFLQIKSLMMKKSNLTFDEAKKKWPDWAERVQKKGPRKRRKYVCHHGLYSWWLNEIRAKAVHGHRYFCIMCLAIFAEKCDVDEDELYKDAASLIDHFNEIAPEYPFDEDDVVAALEAYQDCYSTFPRRDVERLSGITIPPAKRNGRTRAEHVQRITLLRDMDYPDGSWRNKEGRPVGSGTAQATVHQWQEEHPTGRKADCVRDTGLSKPTVYKWWSESVERTDS